MLWWFIARETANRDLIKVLTGTILSEQNYPVETRAIMKLQNFYWNCRDAAKLLIMWRPELSLNFHCTNMLNNNLLGPFLNETFVKLELSRCAIMWRHIVAFSAVSLYNVESTYQHVTQVEFSFVDSKLNDIVSLNFFGVELSCGDQSNHCFLSCWAVIATLLYHALSKSWRSPREIISILPKSKPYTWTDIRSNFLFWQLVIIL